jgi:hypothetical protein
MTMRLYLQPKQLLHFVFSALSAMVIILAASAAMQVQGLGLVYYRLKIVDMHGKYEHSETRIIKMDADNAIAKIITVYPNPVVSELRITLASGWQDKAVRIQLMNANG